MDAGVAINNHKMSQKHYNVSADERGLQDTVQSTTQCTGSFKKVHNDKSSEIHEPKLASHIYSLYGPRCVRTRTRKSFIYRKVDTVEELMEEDPVYIQENINLITGYEEEKIPRVYEQRWDFLKRFFLLDSGNPSPETKSDYSDHHSSGQVSTTQDTTSDNCDHISLRLSSTMQHTTVDNCYLNSLIQRSSKQDTTSDNCTHASSSQLSSTDINTMEEDIEWKNDGLQQRQAQENLCELKQSMTDFDNIHGMHIQMKHKTGYRDNCLKRLIANGTPSKLEAYLENIYKTKCEFQIDFNELSFIQHGIEFMVDVYVDQFYTRLKCDGENCQIDHCDAEIVGVGSFYEGTRNGFPDEFDYVVILGTVKNRVWETNDTKGLFKYSDKPITDKPPKHVCSNKKKYITATANYEFPVFTCDSLPGGSISFWSSLSTSSGGPTEKVAFLYKNGCYSKIISVELFLAVRCSNVDKYVKLNQCFCSALFREIKNTGNILFVTKNSTYIGNTSQINESRILNDDWKPTIVETEKRFVTELLSQRHRKVYRLIKYLVHGPFRENLLKKQTHPGKPSFCLSSYKIKTAVIHHHYMCENKDGTLSACVIHVLTYLLQNSTIFNLCNSVHVSTICLVNFPRPLSNPSPATIANGKFSQILAILLCWKNFIERLLCLGKGQRLSKCEHDFEDSLQEMLLRLQFYKQHAYISSDNKKYESYVSDIDMNVDVSFERYKAKRKEVVKCPWCDFNADSK